MVRNGRDAPSSQLRNNSRVTGTVNARLRKFNGRFVRRCKVDQVKNEKRREGTKKDEVKKPGSS